jgi:hypothetical protein
MSVSVAGFIAVGMPTTLVMRVAAVIVTLYRAKIEPTFERYVYGPLVRAVLRVAAGMKVLQAGSLHACLACVLVLAVLLLIWLGRTL